MTGDVKVEREIMCHFIEFRQVATCNEAAKLLLLGWSGTALSSQGLQKCLQMKKRREKAKPMRFSLGKTTFAGFVSLSCEICGMVVLMRTISSL